MRANAASATRTIASGIIGPRRDACQSRCGAPVRPSPQPAAVVVHEERFASRSGDVSAQSGERVAVVVGVAAVLVDSEELGERPDGFVSDAAFGFALDAGGGERTRASMQRAGHRCF